VNAPRSCWPDVIQKKKDKKKSKYVALDFSEKTNPKKKDKKRSKYVAQSVFAAHFWGVAESTSQRPLMGRNALSPTDGRTDGRTNNCVKIKRVSQGCQF
jgi:hypothetical protein